LTSKSWHNRVQARIAAVHEAARLWRYVQDVLVQPSAKAKPNRTLVMAADYDAQAVVCRLIRERFAHDGIIAEKHTGDLLAAGQMVLSRLRMPAPAGDECLDQPGRHEAAAQEMPELWVFGAFVGGE